MVPLNVPWPLAILTGTRIETGTVVLVAPLFTTSPPNEVRPP